MSEVKRHKFTAVIADAEPIVFTIEAQEEAVFRKAASHVNELWRKMQADQPHKSSHYALAKVALAFAELYYRKSEQLERQSRLLEEFEHSLDDILLAVDD